MARQREMVRLFAALHEGGGRQQSAVAQQELPPGEPLGEIGRRQFRMVRLFGCRQYRRCFGIHISLDVRSFAGGIIAP